MKHNKIYISTTGRKMKCIILKPAKSHKLLPGILWIHGGGYMLGMAEMVYVSCGKMLAKKYGAVVISPGYTLANKSPYPAALNDCYSALEYMWDHAEKPGIDRSRIIVGGESAGGGLAAAVCLYARDLGKVKISIQIPLYPMIDCRDTSSSRCNHGRVWNTRRNHWGWSHYLGKLYGAEDIPAYASPAHAEDLHRLPPCYTFVSDGEPFYQETVDYVNRLRQAGVRASADVYPGNVHAFDLLCPGLKRSRAAKKKLCRVYEEWSGINIQDSSVSGPCTY